MNQDFILASTTSDILDQGQIFKDIKFSGVNDNLHYAVSITPACDLAQKKADHIAFCAILPFEEAFFAYILKTFELSFSDFKAGLETSKQNKAIKEWLMSLFNNEFPRFHWIGEIPNVEKYWYVDYQMIQSFGSQHFESLDKKRIAKLISPVKESVYVRYGTYMSRVGLYGETKDREEFALKVMEFYKKIEQ